MRLTLITSNAGKAEEFQEALAPLGIELEHCSMPYAEPQAESLEEVVRHGMEELRSRGLQDFIIDDSGLFVDALGGFPGVYSAYALKTIGNDGLLRLLEGNDEREAEFRCCIGCSREGFPDILVSGSSQGVILKAAVGEGGFGYDPIFSPDGERSYAQMGLEEKNVISHRGRAIEALREALRREEINHMDDEGVVLVTGAAGFIGSHLVDALLAKGRRVRGLDNMSAGMVEHLEESMQNPRFELLRLDMVEDDLDEALDDVGVIYHLAANPDVRSGVSDTRSHFDQNILATYRLLEACRDRDVKTFVFSSTSAVYGETESMPTREDEPLQPISMYGASKAACEALIHSFCHHLDMRGVIFRFANVVGSRSTHNVLHDFVRKLRDNPLELEILGAEPGTYKSYIHVEDCVLGILRGADGAPDGVSAFNIGSQDQTVVKDIADIVVEEMGLEEVLYRWTGGVAGGGGWVGDVRQMLLSTESLRSLGWAPSKGSHQSIRLAVQEILASKR